MMRWMSLWMRGLLPLSLLFEPVSNHGVYFVRYGMQLRGFRMQDVGLLVRNWVRVGKAVTVRFQAGQISRWQQFYCNL